MAMANDRVHPRKRKKVCSFCVDKVAHIDFKDTAKLRRYLSERGKILPRWYLRCASASADGRHQARPPHRPAAVRSRIRDKKIPSDGRNFFIPGKPGLSPEGAAP